MRASTLFTAATALSLASAQFQLADDSGDSGKKTITTTASTVTSTRTVHLVTTETHYYSTASGSVFASTETETIDSVITDVSSAPTPDAAVDAAAVTSDVVAASTPVSAPAPLLTPAAGLYPAAGNGTSGHAAATGFKTNPANNANGAADGKPAASSAPITPSTGGAVAGLRLDASLAALVAGIAYLVVV